MNTSRKPLLGLLLLAGLQFGLSGCVSDAYIGTGVYYGPRHRPWFHDDPWMDGHHWYGGSRSPERGVDIYISPPRVSVPIELPAPPRLRLP